MTTDNFDIRKSNKAHIDSPEQYIVVRGGIVYLRIVGQEGAYFVMTATSGEDSELFVAYGDQAALHESAIAVAKHLECIPKLKQDFQSRTYFEICQCEFLSDAHRAAVQLFENLEQGER